MGQKLRPRDLTVYVEQLRHASSTTVQFMYGIRQLVAFGSLLEATSRSRSLLRQQTYELA